MSDYPTPECRHGYTPDACFICLRDRVAELEAILQKHIRRKKTARANLVHLSREDLERELVNERACVCYWRDLAEKSDAEKAAAKS